MIAVRNFSKLGIFNLFKQRMGNDTVTEFGTALQQVYNITDCVWTSFCSQVQQDSFRRTAFLRRCWHRSLPRPICTTASSSGKLGGVAV